MTAAERLLDMARVLGDTGWGASLADELREIADEAERESRRGENPNSKARRQRMQAHVMEVQRICAERKKRIKELNAQLAEVRAEAAGYARTLGICADGTPARRLDEVWTVDGDGPYHVDCNWADGTASLVEVAGHVACRTLTHERPGSKTEADRARADDGEPEGVSGHDRDVLAWVGEHGGLSQVEDVYNDLRAVVERLGIEWSESELHGLMDALDRRLMPEGAEWPRYTDGSPVEIGDDVIGPDYGEHIHVDEVTIHANGFSLHEQRIGFDKWYEDGARFARPVPKVLDADGAEIELGDDLYSVEGGLKFHVGHIDRINGKIATDAMFALDKWADPAMYTHRATILAADGKPIREGETVWCTNGHGPFEVTSIVYADKWRVVCDSEEIGHLNVFPESITHRAPVLAADGRPLREGETVLGANGGAYLVTGVHDGKVFAHHVGGSFGAEVESAGGEGLYRLRADQLTHERPESWERLEEDAAKTTTEYWGCPADGCDHCSARVDGEKPWERLGTHGDCNDAKELDLVRRARALAERGQ